ncbi:MAG: DTW domain-containing protein, partial [Deltaproteobacteria bacterium]
MRPFCYRCHKAQAHCICSTLTAPLPHRCAVSVLQHPREQHHPFGTARLLRLGLQHCEVHVCPQLTAPPAVRERVHEPHCVLLFPHPKAQPLARRAAGQTRRLIVLDGTWPQARSLYRHNPWLAALPHVSIEADDVDRYQIRREPRRGYTSTLEAVVRALQLVEPGPQPFDRLLQAFAAMIAAQLPRHRGRACPRRRRRAPTGSRLPASYLNAAARQVLVSCELLAAQSAAEADRLVCLA